MVIAPVQMGEAREGGSLGELETYSEDATQAMDTTLIIQITDTDDGRAAMEEVVAWVAEDKAAEAAEWEEDGKCHGAAIAHNFYFPGIFLYTE